MLQQLSITSEHHRLVTTEVTVSQMDKHISKGNRNGS
jgi:hypothetical protein